MEIAVSYRPLLLTLTLLVACFPSGQIDFRVVIANENDRAIEVVSGGGQAPATITEVALTLDVAFLEGPREVVVFNEKTLLDFGPDEAISFEIESRIGRYSKAGLIFGNADDTIAGFVGDPLYEGASLRLAGTVDLDPNAPGEETPWVALIPAPLGRELQLFQEFELKSGEQIVVAVGLDLQALLDGVDFAALILNANGVIIIARNDPNNAAEVEILESNVEGAFSLIE